MASPARPCETGKSATGILRQIHGPAGRPQFHRPLSPANCRRVVQCVRSWLRPLDWRGKRAPTQDSRTEPHTILSDMARNTPWREENPQQAEHDFNHKYGSAAHGFSGSTVTLEFLQRKLPAVVH